MLLGDRCLLRLAGQGVRKGNLRKEEEWQCRLHLRRSLARILCRCLRSVFALRRMAQRGVLVPSLLLIYIKIYRHQLGFPTICCNEKGLSIDCLGGFCKSLLT